MSQFFVKNLKENDFIVLKLEMKILCEQFLHLILIDFNYYCT
jgi:hypothetical protein